MIPNSLADKLRMSNGVEIPYLGIGTWAMRGKSVDSSIKEAVKVGYRMIDTASYYNNEEEIGKTLLDLFNSNVVGREEIFVTTKIWPNDFGAKSTRKAFLKSQNKLKLDQIDLYLIHWPSSSKTKRLETWNALVDLYEEGLTRSIGVSNFSIDQIKELEEISDLLPTINQVKFNPFSYNQHTLKYCLDNEIAVEAYSPINQGNGLNNATLKSMSQKYGKSVGQIMLRWCIEMRTIVIPKSSNPQRIKENSEIFDFELSGEDVEKISSLT